MSNNKLKEIAYELKNLWNYLSRAELCEYYKISTRTLYNYSTKLNLPKKSYSEPITIDKPITVLINRYGKYEPETFKSWEHFVQWEKAQSHHIKIQSIINHNQSLIVVDFLNKRKEAINYEKLLKI